jgi:hypothetical protein
MANGKSDWPGDTQPPISKETQSHQPAAAGNPQGRRVTIGGMNRRGSLGFDQKFDALFGRRTSGFELDNLFARRGSMDSTTAAFDATLMDLTRRRLSMAGGANDPLSSIDSLGGIGGMNFNLGNMGAMNPMASLPGLTSPTPTAAAASKTQDSSNVTSRSAAGFRAQAKGAGASASAAARGYGRTPSGDSAYASADATSSK